ncbi:fungal-specific transcription factor domain-domain-containing protein, partial [Tuber borchii]
MQATSPPINGSSAPSSVPAKAQTLPLQKRRRVTRACDECRRKKIKCDGKQPCTHCTVYSYECTYDQPSNRRRNPAPQYIEALETRLHRMEALLKVLLPDVDVNHPNFDLGKLLSQVQTNAATRAAGKDVTASSGRPPVVNGSATTSISAEKDSLLESMVEAAGRLDIDESGHMDFRGHSSGVAFLAHLNTQLSDLLGSDACGKALVKVRAAPFPNVFDTPGSAAGSPFDGQIPNTSMLPTKEVAKVLLDVCMDDACVLMRFVHRPTFDDVVNRIYEKDPNDFGDDENNHLPLLYLAFSVGCIFSSDLTGVGILDPVAEGTKYFNIGRRMIEITDCWDIPSIQCVIMMVLFLQSSARMSTCYSYLGIALSASVRMGLHRSLPEARFDPIERETRKRIFWTVRKMDTYVGALLGLPKGIADEDIDQEMPAEVDDEFITKDAILPQPDGVMPMILAANAHCNLLKIMAKMVKYIYPLKGVEASVTGKRSNYSVSSSKLGEIECDLQAWLEKLPMQLRPGGDTPKELQKVQYLLKMAFAHVQMMLYRPFLHYISRPKNEGCDERPYASAANCVNVSRKIVHTAGEMGRLGILNGAYWFTMYTCFFSVITLVYFVLENPEEITSLAVLRDAEMGRELLASMRDRSQAAKRCSVALAALFGNLPGNLRPGLEKANLAIKKKRARASSQTKASSEDPPA